MKKAWFWIKDNVAVVLGVIAATLLFIIYQWWKRDQVNSLKDALLVSETEKDIEVLTERRKAIGNRIAGREVEVNEINKMLEVNKRTIVEARTGATGLSEDDIIEEYRRLGYVE